MVLYLILLFPVVHGVCKRIDGSHLREAIVGIRSARTVCIDDNSWPVRRIKERARPIAQWINECPQVAPRSVQVADAIPLGVNIGAELAVRIPEIRPPVSQRVDRSAHEIVRAEEPSVPVSERILHRPGDDEWRIAWAFAEATSRALRTDRRFAQVARA